MGYDRINTRLSGPLSDFVARMVGEDGSYETPSEYVRDLIRRDMKKHEDELQAAFEAKILRGYRDYVEGHYIASTGNFKDDMALYEKRKAEGWK